MKPGELWKTCFDQTTVTAKSIQNARYSCLVSFFKKSVQGKYGQFPEGKMFEQMNKI